MRGLVALPPFPPLPRHVPRPPGLGPGAGRTLNAMTDPETLLPDATPAERAALEWFHCCGRGLSAAEEAEFERWLDADPEHARLFAEFDGTWALLGESRPAEAAARAPAHPGRRVAAALAAVTTLAAALGDIGRHFPDTDPRWRGADSRTLLRAVAGMLQERGWSISNVDATVIAQAPKLAPHIPGMVAAIRADLGLAADRVNVKAKTSERLGYAGRGEGIAAEAAVLLRR